MQGQRTLTKGSFNTVDLLVPTSLIGCFWYCNNY